MSEITYMHLQIGKLLERSHREYVHSVAVYQKYLLRLQELIIL